MLPDHVGPAFEVYLNGVPQVRGVDYDLQGRTLIFHHELSKEGKLGFWRWLSLFLGVAGTYRKHETVDVQYEVNGRPRVAANLKPEASP